MDNQAPADKKGAPLRALPLSPATYRERGGYPNGRVRPTRAAPRGSGQTATATGGGERKNERSEFFREAEPDAAPSREGTPL